MKMYNCSQVWKIGLHCSCDLIITGSGHKKHHTLLQIKSLIAHSVDNKLFLDYIWTGRPFNKIYETKINKH